MKTLFILTNSSGVIPQKLIETESLPVEEIRNIFAGNGYSVIIFTYDEFISKFNEISDRINNSFFFYASSQYSDYKSSIEDILLLIENSGGILIPSFSHFRAHENKYYQELVKNQLAIPSPDSVLISTIEEGMDKIKTTGFPVVAKLSSGFGSRNVSLIRNEKEAEKYLTSNMSDVLKLRKNLIKYADLKKQYSGKHPLKTGKIIFQKFLSGVEYDWKILVFGNKFFYLKRYTKKNDFRSSGSGLFDSESLPGLDILKFAGKIKDMLNTPWVSLDIIKKEENIFLIEYQCMHFGLYTMISNKGFYEYSGNDFIHKKETINVDSVIAETLFDYADRISLT